MSGKAVLKVRFNASSQKFERFGNDMYLVYLPYPEDGDSLSVLQAMLSKNIGLPPGRIEFAGKDVRGNWVFELV